MNIYTTKYVKFYPIIPLALFLVGLIALNFMEYSTSLKGGIEINIITNYTYSTSQIYNLLSKLNISNAEVTLSKGGITIILPMNASLAKANNYLINFYSNYSTYQSLELNKTTISLSLNKKFNETLANELENINNSIEITKKNLTNLAYMEYKAIANMIKNKYNITNNSIDQLQVIISDMYSNASKYYVNFIINGLKQGINITSYSYQQVTPTLSKYFTQQVLYVLITAFILIAIFAFIIFRSFAPSFTVVFGALNDLLVAIIFMDILHIPFGLTSLAALLMLLGFAMDTDMLAAIRILKRHEGNVEDRAYNAMRTGITMTTSAIATFSVLFVISLIFYVPTYYEISGVVLFGLIGDIFTSWFGNAVFLMIYKKRRGG